MFMHRPSLLTILQLLSPLTGPCTYGTAFQFRVTAQSFLEKKGFRFLSGPGSSAHVVT